MKGNKVREQEFRHLVVAMNHLLEGFLALSRDFDNVPQNPNCGDLPIGVFEIDQSGRRN